MREVGQLDLDSSATTCSRSLVSSLACAFPHLADEEVHAPPRGRRGLLR